MSSVITTVTDRLNAGKGCNIITVNPELVMTAQKNPAFKQAIDEANIVTPDGIGLRMVGALTKRKLKERVTGVDLCDKLAELAANNKWSIYLLGSQPGVAAAAAQKLQAKYPGLMIAGASSADPDHDSTKEIVASKANILLVAYGSPTQELWIKERAKTFSHMVTIGVGGSFDFIAGTAKRAPRWVQKIGLEWLWRLILQPRRLKRMLALPKFAIMAIFE
jgi:N-acetylglucosaminyldiphosphoundecaprenol N-acetyl-beta-D-mannosaminyltransferase